MTGHCFICDKPATIHLIGTVHACHHCMKEETNDEPPYLA